MVTLLRVTTNGRSGRCDAKCHDAHDADCDCVCGGINHGVGLEQAVRNTRGRADALAAQYASARGIDPNDLTIAVGAEVAGQDTLFQ